MVRKYITRYSCPFITGGTLTDAFLSHPLRGNAFPIMLPLMDESAVRENLRAFITRELMREPGYPLTGTEGIITGGMMDSFALAEMGVYIEREFGVYIPDPDLTVLKMNTLDQIVARVLQG